MKPIHTWLDMRQFGVNILTGEACAYSMRVLCDVNEDGAALLREYLGLALDPLPFARNWNSTVDGKLAIGSVMLHRDSLKQLATFACFRAGALAVVDGSGINPICEPERVAQYTSCGATSWRLIRNPTLNTNQPHVGSRNVHAFTGRTE